MKFTFHFLFLIILFLNSSCKKHSRKKFDLLKVTELGSAKVSDSTIAKILSEYSNIDLDIKYSLSEDIALQELLDKNIDLAIIPDNTQGCYEYANLRTITPLLPRILVILSSNISNTNDVDIADLFENNKLVFEDLSRLDSIFFNTLFDNFGVNRKYLRTFSAHKIDLDKWRDSSFIFIGLTHPHNPLVKKLINHDAELITLDNINKLGKGSTVDGLKMNYPKLSPFIIPKSLYKGVPKKPILTIAIYDILVARKDFDKTVVHDILKTLIENKAQLTQNDNIYSLFNPRYEKVLFSFPLHKGAIDYLNRNEPSIWTRYASIIWPFASILAILAGAFASLRQSVKQRKKMRIETLYKSLLKTRKHILSDNPNKSKEKLLEEIHGVRARAFNALMENKLEANVSFYIFLSLYNEIINEIEKTANE